MWDLRMVRRGRDAMVKAFHGHRGWVKNVQYIEEERCLFSSGFDGTIRRWEIDKHYPEDPAPDPAAELRPPPPASPPPPPDFPNTLAATNTGPVDQLSPRGDFAGHVRDGADDADDNNDHDSDFDGPVESPVLLSQVFLDPTIQLSVPSVIRSVLTPPHSFNRGRRTLLVSLVSPAVIVAVHDVDFATLRHDVLFAVWQAAHDLVESPLTRDPAVLHAAVRERNRVEVIREAHEGAAEALEVDPRGDLLAARRFESASEDDSLRLYALHSRRSDERLRTLRDAVETHGFVPAAAIGNDSALATDRLIWFTEESSAAGAFIKQPTFSGASQLVVSPWRNGVRLFSSAAPVVRAAKSTHTDVVLCTAAHPYTLEVCCAGLGGEVRVLGMSP